MIRRIPWVAAAFAAFLFVLPVAADEKTKPANAQAEGQSKAGVKVEVAHTFRASDIMSMDVRNKQGKEVGSINDLVIELNSGEIRYAALSCGGFAGFGDKLFAVPWKGIQFKFDEDDRYLVVDVNQEKLENAAGFDENHWPNVGDPKWAATVDKNFAEGEAADTEGKDTEDKSARDAQPAPDGKSATKTEGDKVVFDAVYRVSSLKGMEVRNEEGKDLGQINELVFDLRKGKVAYAALSHGGVLGVGDKLFAIPFDAFKLKHKADEKFLVLNVAEEKLANAPGFDENHWPDVVNPKWAEEIDRHYEISRKPKDGDLKRE